MWRDRLGYAASSAGEANDNANKTKIVGPSSTMHRNDFSAGDADSC